MANAENTASASASTLQKCKALLKEVVTELNSSASNSSTSNSEAITPRPARTADAIQNEHRRLFGFQYRGGGRGRYNPFSRGGPRPLKAPKQKRQPTWTRTFVCLPNKSDAFPPTFAEYAGLKKAGLGDRKITLNLDYGPLEVDQKLKEAFPKLEDSGGYALLRTPERGCRNLTLIEGPYSAEILKGSIGQGKIFIRPLQNDLPLTVDAAAKRSVSHLSLLKFLIGINLKSEM